MDELETLLTELVAEGTRKNNIASARMYGALVEIARVGTGDAKIEADIALNFRNRQ